jgi:hypothetical protein
MNQALNSALNQSTQVTVTSVVGNPVLTFEGVPSVKIIAKEVARKFGYQMQGGISVAHSFCGVIDPAPEEELRPEGIDLWCKEGHEGSRRWACQ